MNAAQEKLAAAKRQIVDAEARSRTAQETAAAALRKRENLVDEARKALAEVRTLLFSRLEQVPRSANRGDSHSEGAGLVKFGNALAGPNQPINGKWDIVAWAPIQVTCNIAPYTWSASLIYADLGDANGHRWYEISFFEQLSGRRRDVPFALNPNEPEFREAVGSLSRTAIAFGPSSLNGDEARGAFLDRWTDRFADAMLGKLVRPMSLPIANS